MGLAIHSVPSVEKKEFALDAEIVLENPMLNHVNIVSKLTELFPIFPKHVLTLSHMIDVKSAGVTHQVQPKLLSNE
jgi:hypothetical protein